MIRSSVEHRLATENERSSQVLDLLFQRNEGDAIRHPGISQVARRPHGAARSSLTHIEFGPVLAGADLDF